MHAAMPPQHTCAQFVQECMMQTLTSGCHACWLSAAHGEGTRGLCPCIFFAMDFLQGSLWHGRGWNHIQFWRCRLARHRDLLQSSSARRIKEETSTW